MIKIKLLQELKLTHTWFAGDHVVTVILTRAEVTLSSSEILRSFYHISLPVDKTEDAAQRL